jgi:23S rRNA pseudouridine2605 synthase
MTLPLLHPTKAPGLPPMRTPEVMRIHKALAEAGVASRRAAEQLVAAGRVTVNGARAEIGQQVDPERDELMVDGRAVGGPSPLVYLVLAKPAGVTSTVSDRHAHRTVVELVPGELRRRAARIYPVGRLDQDSEGLLLLTNDGAWAQQLLHPSHGVEREYAVGLARQLDGAQRRQLLDGVVLDEGTARLDSLRPSTSAEVRRLIGLLGAPAGRLNWYQTVVRQGWRRQLRRMFAALGMPVERLVRVRLGSLRLAGMALGDVRELSGRERRQLESLAREPARDRPDEARAAGLVVSLDGPGSSGKSSVGAAAATSLRYRFCDTGVLYRGLTWLALARQVELSDDAALVSLVGQLDLQPDDEERYVRLLCDGREVTDLLHTAAVDRHVSQVARHAQVRGALLPLQRRLAAGGRIIMAGRDIGTVVLPDADLKLFLHVSLEERARRRAEARGALDDEAEVARIAQELRRRDGIDSSRAVAPLTVPADALVIETEGNTLQQTVAVVVAEVRRAEKAGPGG